MNAAETDSLDALGELVTAVNSFNASMERVNSTTSRLDAKLRELERSIGAVDTTLRAAVYESARQRPAPPTSADAAASSL